EAGINLIGRSLHYIEGLIDSDYPAGFISDLIGLGKIKQSFEQINPYRIDIGGAPYYLILSTAPGYYLLEFENVIAEVDSNIQKLLGYSISNMLAAKSLSSLLDNATLQVK